MSDGAPFHVVQAFPFGVSRRSQPVLFIETHTGELLVHDGALSWVRSRPGARYKSVIDDLKILGRIHDFHIIAWRGEILQPEDRRTFIWSYLDARYHGTRHNEPLSELHWDPVSFSTVRSEFNSIARYYKYRHLSNAWSLDGFSSSNEILNFSNSMYAETKETQRNFLSHLATSRARWASLFGSRQGMPDLGVREPPRTSGTFSLDRTIDRRDAELIIQNEKNPTYKAMWILGAFGGPRISEMLHMWQCDVLPASTGFHVTGRPQKNVFVLIAHPSESRYLGDFTRLGKTRLAELSSKYGLRPRNFQIGYRAVGWKDPLMTDSKLVTSEVFWCDDTYADEFAKCIAEIRHFHTKHNTSSRHPYLFVNTRHGDGFGEPVSYNKARDAFARACTRVGLTPSINGRRIHGLRHLYKLILTQLGLPSDYIQIAMRHKSMESQTAYGQTSSEIRAFLDEKMSRRPV